MMNKDGATFHLNDNTGRRMAQTESYTLSFRLPDAAAGDRPRYAGMNVERPLLLAAIGRFGWWIQPVNATRSLNLSAGVWKPSVFRCDR